MTPERAAAVRAAYCVLQDEAGVRDLTVAELVRELERCDHENSRPSQIIGGARVCNDCGAVFRKWTEVAP